MRTWTLILVFLLIFSTVLTGCATNIQQKTNIDKSTTSTDTSSGSIDNNENTGDTIMPPAFPE
jgi:outer membrane lipopolysaccharide assembly protein LptE/RlpB